MARSVFAVLAFLISSSLAASEAPTHRYLVATRGHLGKADIPFRNVEQRDFDTFKSVEGFSIELTSEEAAQLRLSPLVRFVEPDLERHASAVNGVVRPATANSRTAQNVPYGIDLVKAARVWSVASGQRIKVAVLDTGIDGNHPDLREHYRGGFDFVENDALPQDGNGHGTHVAGTIAALNNEFGVVGVAPNVELYAVRVLNSAGSGTTSNIIKAIDWAIANGMNVLNLSLGSEDSSKLEEQAFQRAADAGIITVAASGNAFDELQSDLIDFPAGYPTVIAVGAVDANSVVADFSQRGAGLKLVAPGVAVLSSVRTGSGSIADVQLRDGNLFGAVAMTGSPLKEIVGQYVFVGRGRAQDFTSEVIGKIALIERDPLSIPSEQRMTFNEKARNAKAAGAAAVVIHNRESGTFGGTLISQSCDPAGQNCSDNPADLDFEWPLTVAISLEDGLELRNRSAGEISVNARSADYGLLQGTSMSTPHVAGVAALIWSVAPHASAAQVRDALLNSAVDLGAPGFDTIYGYGLVDGYAAARALAPEQFPPAPTHVRRRR